MLMHIHIFPYWYYEGSILLSLKDLGVASTPRTVKKWSSAKRMVENNCFKACSRPQKTLPKIGTVVHQDVQLEILVKTPAGVCRITRAAVKSRRLETYCLSKTQADDWRAGACLKAD